MDYFSDALEVAFEEASIWMEHCSEDIVELIETGSVITTIGCERFLLTLSATLINDETI